MINKKLSYLVLSDIHLGHRLNKTQNILSHLREFFKTYHNKISECDLIFIAGDLFDTLLDLSSQDIHDILIWINELMQYCATYQIKLRILEGTPSHDWAQSSMFETLDRITSYPYLDYKYIPALSIEKIQEYNLSILYIPDEWHSDTKETYRQVLELLKIENLQKIDIAIMHGQFNYQLPSAAIKAPRHDELSYLNIVDHYINIGHVHQFSTFERILAQGSFDRLSHGDEEPKGALLMTISPNHENTFEFLVNKAATIFKTIFLKNKDFQSDLYQILDKAILKYPKGSFIRLKTKEKDHLNALYDEIKKRYLDYYLTKDFQKEESSSYSSLKLDLNKTIYSPIVIRAENIKDLLLEQIRLKYPWDEKKFQLCQELIEQGVQNG